MSRSATAHPTPHPPPLRWSPALPATHHVDHPMHHAPPPRASAAHLRYHSDLLSAYPAHARAPRSLLRYALPLPACWQPLRAVENNHPDPARYPSRRLRIQLIPQVMEHIKLSLSWYWFLLVNSAAESPTSHCVNATASIHVYHWSTECAMANTHTYSYKIFAGF